MPPAIRNGFVTFGSLNKIVKVSRPCVQLWARVLEAAPQSKLMLAASAADAAPIVERLAPLGLGRERLLVVGKVRGRREYLQGFGQIDIALDTFPFNGITTTCDGLWMGVPAVSLAGATSVSRAGRSILRGVGLAELAADTADEFVRIATELAGDLQRLRDLRLNLREQMKVSPLMDHKTFTANLELEFWEMYQRTAGAI
jgi:predicted O-linked N-acetylglucosamine transferase (SPINDLY family)